MTWSDRRSLVLMMAVVLVWQIPLFGRTRAGQDESFYGVPGMMILRSGLPQIPYIPSRDPETIYYHADEILYTLPPLGFYLEAAVHLVLGDGLAPARLASMIAGLVAVAIVCDLTRRCSGSSRAALLAAASFLFSRAFLFPATTARPDMAAIAFGLGAVWWVSRDDRRWRDVALGGVMAGLSMLCHPLGLVPTAQVGLALLVGGRPWRRRIGEASVYSAVALAVFGLWLPMIAMHPELFRIQFGGNVLDRAGPGLGETIVGLPGVLAFQAWNAFDHVGPIQAGLYGLGTLWLMAEVTRKADQGQSRRVLFHVVAAVVLLVLLMGSHHIRNYYGYPAALLSVPVGLLLDRAASRLGALVGTGWAKAIVAAMLVLAMVPGSGLRVLGAHLQHWTDPNYRVGPFVDRIVADLPPGALVAADGSYVLEFFLRDRPVVEAIVDPFYFNVRLEPFEYAVFGPVGLEQIRPEIEGLELVETYGDPSDPFGHYAELYRRVRTDSGSRSAF
ncbi:ArnT family glycosyltransferase [Tautonia rosea]|uniref:ArnT family glycosyltransferase n=1 Tax=Tautonia rosea TaxID=2728037 RepID=UPI001472ED45|nr:glycosyltransferase family 39 protein [Tautonia rosea]